MVASISAGSLFSWNIKRTPMQAQRQAAVASNEHPSWIPDRRASTPTSPSFRQRVEPITGELVIMGKPLILRGEGREPVWTSEKGRDGKLIAGSGSAFS